MENFLERHDRAGLEEQKQLETERLERRDRFIEHMRHFQKRLFVVAVPAGFIAILAGTFIALQAVETGLIFGDILSITTGYPGIVPAQTVHCPDSAGNHAEWLGEKDSNPHSQIQNLMSYP